MDCTFKRGSARRAGRPEFAIRLLESNLAAGIEAPLRLYITEDPDGTASLSYKTAGHVLARYAEEAARRLKTLAAEFDTILEQIADQAAASSIAASWIQITR